MIHKNMKHLTSMLIILLLTTAVAAHAYQSAPPPLPASFYGTVDGQMNEDAVVTAVIHHQIVAQTTLSRSGDQWVYSLIVPGDLAGTKAVEGGIPGDTVEFQIDGQAARPTAVWQSGSNTQLDLTAGIGLAIGTTALWLLGGLTLAILVMAVILTWHNHRSASNGYALQEKTSW
jgi:hypothetical protein